MEARPRKRRGVRRPGWLLTVLWVAAGVAVGIAAFPLMFALPKQVALFEELGAQQFPLPTLMVMKASHLLTSKWWVGVVLLIGALLVGRVALGRERWSRLWHSRVGVAAPIIAGVLALIAVPLLAFSMWLPMAGVWGPLAGP